MTRLVCVLLLLSGCAVSRPTPEPVSPAVPATLAEVNAALDGRRVRIELADRSAIAQATLVRVSLTEVSYHSDADPQGARRTVPVSAVERIVRYEQTQAADTGATGALGGAVPGVILLIGPHSPSTRSPATKVSSRRSSPVE